MKNLKTLVVLAFVATTFSTAFAAYTPTMQLEEKIDSVAMKLVTIVESKFDWDFDTVLDVLEKFESKVQGNERNEWILETLQTNLKASMKSMMTDDDGVMDDGVMDEDDMTNKTKVFDISGTNFSFSENEIVVHEGDTVTINFSSESGFHDWVVGEFDAATEQVETWGTTSVTFVASQAGEFEFYCSVGAHRANWMVGTLVVSAAE